MEKAFIALNAVLETITDLDESGFMSVMCMLFDSYHDAHRSFDPVGGAQTVSDLVKQVNGVLGQFETV